MYDGELKYLGDKPFNRSRVYCYYAADYVARCKNSPSNFSWAAIILYVPPVFFIDNKNESNNKRK